MAAHVTKEVTTQYRVTVATSHPSIWSVVFNRHIKDLFRKAEGC